MLLLALAMVLQLPPNPSGYSSTVYPQGVSCDPQTGLLYNVQETSRTPDGCRVDIETGAISCLEPPSGLMVAVQ